MKKKKHTPYWFKVIKTAIKRQRNGLTAFTESQKDKAENWVTCACGKQDPRIPREGDDAGRKNRLRVHADWEPEDAKLSRLGGYFADYVYSNRPQRALECLLAIEKRAAVVLARALKNKPHAP